MTPHPLRGLAAAAMVALALLGASSGAQAQASLPYTPSASARHALSLLVDEADLAVPLGSWPLPAGAVQAALSELPARLSPALERARATVSAELDAHRRARVDLTLAGRTDTLVGFGDDYAPASHLSLRGEALGGGAAGRIGDTGLSVTARLGARLQTDPGPPAERSEGVRARLDDSAVAFEALGVQLQASTRSAWWGPGWRSSLILGNNVPALAGVSLQRASTTRSASPWLSWLGVWNAEFFIAQAEGDAAPAYAWLVGQRLTTRPWPGVELGVSRMAQWGGQGRDQSARSFAHMLTGVGTNADTADQLAADPGNQLAGFDLRLRCPAGLRCAAYAQLIGEDMAGYLPSRYLSLYGAEAWSADGRRRLVVEYADSASGSTPDAQRFYPYAYRNSLYPNGYASAGRWLGASQGPDVRLLSFSLFEDPGAVRLRADIGVLSGFPGGAFTQASAQSGPGVAHLRALSAQRSIVLAGGTLTPMLGWQRLVGPTVDTTTLRIGANWSRPLEGRSGTESGPALWAGWSERQPWLGAAGLLAAGLALDRPADRYAQDHGSNASMQAMRKVGDALPTLALGLAGSQWLYARGSSEGDTAFAAAAAGVSAYGASRGLKSVFGRDRPRDGFGPASFGQSATTPRSDSSLPSNHAAMAWAVLTPYAQAYGQDWLYGLAALTGAGRVMGREHWVSDVVAGSLLGYQLGSRMPGWLAGAGRLSWTGRGVSWQTALP